MRLWLAGAACWALALFICLVAGLARGGRLGEAHFGALSLVFLGGGLLAWLAGLPIIAALGRGRPAETRFAAALLVLSSLSLAAPAAIFALQYRLFYAQWHAPFGTRIWILQFVFTSASALYQFAVLGTRLMLPAAPLAIFAASLYLARRMR